MFLGKQTKPSIAYKPRQGTKFNSCLGFHHYGLVVKMTCVA